MRIWKCASARSTQVKKSSQAGVTESRVSIRNCFHPLVEPFEIKNGSNTPVRFCTKKKKGTLGSTLSSEGTLAVTPISRR